MGRTLRDTIEPLTRLRRRYRIGRVAVLATFFAAVILVLLIWDAPQPVWGIAGLVAGVMAEDLIRGLMRRLRLALRRVDPGRTRTGQFHLGAASWPTEIVDLPPGGIPLDAILIRVDGTLQVPEHLLLAAERLRSLLEDDPLPGDVVFDDNPCLITLEPPLVTRKEKDGRERVGLSVRAAPSQYFVKALARGAVPETVLTHVQGRWPQELTDLEDIRASLVAEMGDAFHPLRHPGFGLCLATVIDDGGVLYTAWQERGLSTAVNAGRRTAPIDEALTLSDRDDHLPTVDMRRWIARSVFEEIGRVPYIRTSHIEGAMWDLEGGGSIDRNGVSSGGGLTFVGWVEIPMTPDEFIALNARDRFESGVFHLIPLTVADVAASLQSAPPERWFGPAVAALAHALDAFRPGALSELHRELIRSSWVGPSKR